MAKKYFWFKMQDDFFKSKEIKKLRKIAGGDTFTIIYQKMILLSIKTQGKVFYDGIEDNFADEIALEIDEDVENVRLTLAFVIKNKLVDVMSENEIVMTEAIKNIGTQDESTERVRLHRERKKQGLLPLHVTNETTEIEIEKELEIEKEKDKSVTCKTNNFLDAYVFAFKKYFGMMPRIIHRDDFDASVIDNVDLIIMFTEYFQHWEDSQDSPFDNSKQEIQSKCSIENIYAQINRYALHGEW